MEMSYRCPAARSAMVNGCSGRASHLRSGASICAGPRTPQIACRAAGQLRLPATTQDRLHHPGESRPDPPPQELRPRRRPPARARPAPVQAVPRGRRRINRLKRNRAVATRYDKLAVRYEATLHVAAIKHAPSAEVSTYACLKVSSF
jgi:hypothetical protein